MYYSSASHVAEKEEGNSCFCPSLSPSFFLMCSFVGVHMLASPFHLAPIQKLPQAEEFFDYQWIPLTILSYTCKISTSAPHYLYIYFLMPHLHNILHQLV